METQVLKVGEKLAKNNNQGSDKLNANHDELLLTVKDVSQHINESPHVVRNWLKELKPYIPTQQGKNKYHYFNQKGIDRLILIKKMTREQGYSIKQIEYYLATGENPEKREIQPEFEDRILKELEGVQSSLKKQEKFNYALIGKLDEQNRYIQESLKKRDQQLLETMKLMQQEKAGVNTSKKKNFWKLFKKTNE